MKRKGFTLIELLVVIAIIAILAAILLPVFARVRENARRSTCQSNMKQIGNAFLMYCQDYDELTPRAWYISNNGTSGYLWADALMPYTKSVNVFGCPSATAKPFLDQSYTYKGFNIDSLGFAANVNYWGGSAGGGVPANNPFYSKNLAQLGVPATTVLTTDFGGHFESAAQNDIHADFLALPTDPNYRNVYRHLDMAGVLFCDGHAKSLTRDALIATHTVNGVAVHYLFTIEDD